MDGIESGGLGGAPLRECGPVELLVMMESVLCPPIWRPPAIHDY